MTFDKLIASTKIYKDLLTYYNEQVHKVNEMAVRSDNLEEELKLLKTDHACLISEREELRELVSYSEETYDELENKSAELAGLNVQLQNLIEKLQCENDLLKSELASRSGGGVLQ
jgi:hemerythrin-like domain-containing protein